MPSVSFAPEADLSAGGDHQAAGVPPAIHKKSKNKKTTKTWLNKAKNEALYIASRDFWYQQMEAYLHTTIPTWPSVECDEFWYKDPHGRFGVSESQQWHYKENILEAAYAIGWLAKPVDLNKSPTVSSETASTNDISDWIMSLGYKIKSEATEAAVRRQSTPVCVDQGSVFKGARAQWGFSEDRGDRAEVSMSHRSLLAKALYRMAPGQGINLPFQEFINRYNWLNNTDLGYSEPKVNNNRNTRDYPTSGKMRPII